MTTVEQQPVQGWALSSWANEQQAQGGSHQPLDLAKRGWTSHYREGCVLLLGIYHHVPGKLAQIIHFAHRIHVTGIFTYIYHKNQPLKYIYCSSHGWYIEGCQTTPCFYIRLKGFWQRQLAGSNLMVTIPSLRNQHMPPETLGFMGVLRVSLVIYGISLGFMGWNEHSTWKWMVGSWKMIHILLGFGCFGLCLEANC